MAEIQKQIAALRASLETQGFVVPAAAPRGSALGQGFAHPDAALGAPAGPQGQERPGEGPAAPVAGAETAGLQAQRSPQRRSRFRMARDSGWPPADLPQGASRVPQHPPYRRQRRPPTPGKGAWAGRSRRRAGHPEAAIAADRMESGPAAKAASAVKAEAPAPAPAPGTPGRQGGVSPQSRNRRPRPRRGQGRQISAKDDKPAKGDKPAAPPWTPPRRRPAGPAAASAAPPAPRNPRPRAVPRLGYAETATPAKRPTTTGPCSSP